MKKRHKSIPKNQKLKPSQNQKKTKLHGVAVSTMFLKKIKLWLT